jgi:hypothetical protein
MIPFKKDEMDGACSMRGRMKDKKCSPVVRSRKIPSPFRINKPYFELEQKRVTGLVVSGTCSPEQFFE